MADEMIPLADAIVALREQLAEAHDRGAGESLRFEVGPVELELNLAVQREATLGGKIGFKIFGWGSEATAGGKLADERTHRVKITLTPKLDGLMLDVSDRK